MQELLFEDGEINSLPVNACGLSSCRRKSYTFIKNKL